MIIAVSLHLFSGLVMILSKDKGKRSGGSNKIHLLVKRSVEKKLV